jgi:uncharacterized radical SAM protein YgiQ
MYGMQCTNATSCRRSSCIHPAVCKHLSADHQQGIKLMRALLNWAAKQKRKVRMYVASGIRHDLALHSREYLNLLAGHFVGGHLKVAPEHYCAPVLDLMNKPHVEVFEEFEKQFNDLSRRAGKKQYLVPYFISGHPGCTVQNALQLTDYLVSRNWRPRQVQDFVPVPLALATAMYVSGRSPEGKKIHIPRGMGEKKLQMALLQYYDKRNWKQIENFLIAHGRRQLLSRIRHAQSRSGRKCQGIKKNPLHKR